MMVSCAEKFCIKCGAMNSIVIFVSTLHVKVVDKLAKFFINAFLKI
jgi:hypothetical protein